MSQPTVTAGTDCNVNRLLPPFEIGEGLPNDAIDVLTSGVEALA
ncbi:MULTISPECIES: hypothetical protein [unclassified Mycolicibacterium]|nr:MULTISPECIES: hypothetical protein [unclassified Mycolicibacterium]